MLRALRIAPLLLMLAACSAFDSGVAVVTQQELLKQMAAKEDILILDVRTTGEFSSGHIPGAFHLDHREIESRLKEIEAYRDRPVIVYCHSGVRAGMVESYLVEQQFTQVMHLEGDWSAWKENSLPSD